MELFSNAILSENARSRMKRENITEEEFRKALNAPADGMTQWNCVGRDEHARTIDGIRILIEHKLAPDQSIVRTVYRVP